MFCGIDISIGSLFRKIWVRAAQWEFIMKKKKRYVMILLVTLLAAGLITVWKYDRIHYDRSKPNIFEIPSTRSEYSPTIHKVQYEEFYFIQHVPESEEELETMIMDYVEENDILGKATSDKKRKHVLINFMVPDRHFPISFVERRGKFYRHIGEFKQTNRVAYVTYNYPEDKLEFVLWDRHKYQ